jgi:hypothetical protein
MDQQMAKLTTCVVGPLFETRYEELAFAPAL